MKAFSLADTLWGHKAKFRYLLVAAIFILFTLLGGREIWTQEHRWADIVSGMFYRHDFLHPYLGEVNYYDKPLLSYWFIVAFAKITGTLNTFILRLPSALAGLLAIAAIYQLGKTLRDSQLGMLSGWLLLTTFYFLFWARTSSADMLNLGGSLFAIAWYFSKRKQASVFDYSVFFLILALTALCKGLVGAIIPLIAVFVDMCLQKSFKQHLRLSLFLALIPAAIIYLFPFWASNHFGGQNYGESGLYLVYRENILRYFQPFDHQGPIYTYFLYLPLYLMPWAIFFIPALWALKSRWRSMSLDAKWIAWTLLALFLFFTLSGSRRSYYVLPIVPFAILFTADWMLSSAVFAKRRIWVANLTAISFMLLFVGVDVLPAWYYAEYGVEGFAQTLKVEANKTKPWNEWNVVMLDAESKLNFYLQLPPTTKNYPIQGNMRVQQTAETLAQMWPVLTNKPTNTIFITRKLYVSLLQPYFTGYHLVEMQQSPRMPFLQQHDQNAPVAFIPNK